MVGPPSSAPVRQYDQAAAQQLSSLAFETDLLHRNLQKSRRQGVTHPVLESWLQGRLRYVIIFLLWTSRLVSHTIHPHFLSSFLSFSYPALFPYHTHPGTKTTMAPPVDAATRKRVLKVIFISLLLDLVSTHTRRLPPTPPPLPLTVLRQLTRHGRYPSPSFSPCSPSSSSSTATPKPRPMPLPRATNHRPFWRPSLAISTPTRPPLPGQSTPAMTSSSSAAPWAPSSRSSKPSPPLSSDTSPTSTAAATPCWPA